MLLMRLKLRFLQSVVDKADLEAQPQLRIDESYSDRDQDEVLQFSELEVRVCAVPDAAMSSHMTARLRSTTHVCMHE
jgi:hypothetical protein